MRIFPFDTIFFNKKDYRQNEINLKKFSLFGMSRIYAFMVNIK